MTLTEYKPGSAFSGRMGRTVGESSPAWPAPVRSTARRAERSVHRAGRHRLRAVRLLRLADQHPQPGPAGEERASLHQHAHHGAVLAVAVVHADRAQPPLQRHGVHHRGVDGLPGLQRCDPVRERVPVRDAAAARLCHVLRRQVAPDARGTDQRGRPLRPLAAGSRLRPLLRLPRRRHPSVLSRPGLRQPSGRAAEDAGGGLPPHRRSGRQGDRVHRRPQAGRARQAVLPVLRDGRQPCAAPGAQGMGRQVQGQVRRRLGRLPREGVRAAEGTRHRGRGRGAVAARPRRAAMGRAVRRRAPALRPHDGGVRGLLRAH